MRAEIASRLERNRQLRAEAEALRAQPSAAIGMEFDGSSYTNFQPVTAEQLEARLVEILTERKNKTADGIGIDYLELGRDQARIMWRDSLAGGESGLLAKLTRRYTPDSNIQALLMATIAALERIRTPKKPAASEKAAAAIATTAG